MCQYTLNPIASKPASRSAFQGGWDDPDLLYGHRIAAAQVDGHAACLWTLVRHHQPPCDVADVDEVAEVTPVAFDG